MNEEQKITTMDFEYETYVDIYKLYIVVREENRGGRTFKISGFDTHEQLKDFVMFGDFEEFENGWLLFEFELLGKLKWEYGDF